MAKRILEAIAGGPGHPAMEGVPRRSGSNPSAASQDSAMSVLMFMDGSSSLRDLADVLSMDPAALVPIVVMLADEGVISFDEGYARRWLSETPAEPEAPAAPPAAEPEAHVAPTPAAPAAPAPAAPMVGPMSPPADIIKESDPAAPAGEAEAPVSGEVVEEGRLEDVPAWQVITRLTRSGFVGRIRFVSPEGRREVLIGGGIPVFATSDVPAEDLGQILRSRDAITEADWKRYERAREETGEEPSRLLVHLGIVPEYNRLRALRWQAQTIVYAVLPLASGTFIRERLDALPRRSYRFDINFPRILTRFLDEKLPVEQEIETLQEKLEFYIVPTGAPPFSSFEEKEQRLWEAISERPRRLKQILSISTLFKKDTYKFVLLLLVNGLAELTKNVTADENPIDLKMLDDIAEDLATQNHFDVLTLHAVSDLGDIEAAYGRMVKKFDPAAYKGLDEKSRSTIVKCRERLDTAFATLRDEESRNSYRKQIFSPYQLAQFALLQYQKGEIYLWWRQDPTGSHPYFKSAMDMDPSQPLFWAAYAFSAFAGGNAPPAVRSQCLKLAERVASLPVADPVAYILAGGTLIKAGQSGRGEEAVQKGQRLAGNSPATQKMVQFVLKGGGQ